MAAEKRSADGLSRSVLICRFNKKASRNQLKGNYGTASGSIEGSLRARLGSTQRTAAPRRHRVDRRSPFGAIPGARSEPTTAAGLAKSCPLGVPEEVEGGTRQQSIPWRRRHPRHEPAPFTPPPSSHPPVPPGRAHSTCRRLRTAAMFKLKLEPLKMTAWTMNVFVKFR